jgi:hypothetical protein
MRFYILCHAYSITQIVHFRDRDSFILRNFILNIREIFSRLQKKLKLVQKREC